ncbi:FKBP-type peptidyl-prolyl cis-trans isomerase [Flavilitoribacter nigricans]|uniref:Peptidyl-prolyl cis-trans isomerase n=1 Tax=Flavilitoribacter nigricans (strain ATCC 23147 / DSM 23189 / NBRC 102662 / NCIMB 1420 / SS-2) TaxID=1122177 RepID=A0A2D0NDB7_FLAN2|nr:FKBP-type peptidyl-prolyl cis-trans isomerase [Flavilitoribacter nigricans]PHN06492.1 peptidylprolyl isomerase [Flavilitoribacter nigricans DSM 23189 = NBRC 102662]
MNRIIVGLLIIVFGASACKKEVDQAEVDRLLIEEYVAATGLNTQVDPSGLYYVIEEPGTGIQPNISDDVEVRYKGYLLDGTVFDQTTGDKTVVFNLGGLILGWQIAIPLLKEGGKGTFIHPSALAYGRRSAGPLIGPNEVLVFEIELVDVKR